LEKIKKTNAIGVILT